MATRFATTAEGIATAAAWLQAGKCVAFPTETVYGLGANALNEAAILDIFKHKGRPLTDPLIVHVPSTTVAETVVEVSDKARPLFEALTTEFWPGPLTLVLKAQPEVPLKVSAGTGFVGVRQPAHAVAQALLTAAQLPIAAPSANRFGHVSPTTAAHVLADLGGTPIGVVDAEGESAGGTGGGATCAVGIESTVLGVSEDGATLTMFRRGGVPSEAIDSALQAVGISGYAWKASTAAAASAAAASAEAGAAEGEEEAAQVAPGQLLTHYAPDVQTFLLPTPPLAEGEVGAEAAAALARVALLDFGGAFAHLSAHVGAYRDLSPAGDASEAATAVYAALRWTEEVAGAEGSTVSLALVPVDAVSLDGKPGAGVKAGAGLAGALGDRLYRAGSGQRLLPHVPPGKGVSVGEVAEGVAARLAAQGGAQ